MTIVEDVRIVVELSDGKRYERKRVSLDSDGSYDKLNQAVTKFVRDEFRGRGIVSQIRWSYL